jgi:hypothetical protein
METNQIRMESNPDITFYHILIEIRIWIQIFLIQNKKDGLDSYIYSTQLKVHYY